MVRIWANINLSPFRTCVSVLQIRPWIFIFLKYLKYFKEVCVTERRDVLYDLLQVLNEEKQVCHA